MSGVWHFTLLAAIVVLFSTVPAAWGAKPGGWSTVDRNDKGLLKALSFAITEYNNNNNDEYGRKIISVRKAKQQIVAGVNYEAQVMTGLTTCTKPIDNIDECPLHESPEMVKRTRCTFQVSTVPWKDITEVKKSVCF